MLVRRVELVSPLLSSMGGRFEAVWDRYMFELADDCGNKILHVQYMYMYMCIPTPIIA